MSPQVSLILTTTGERPSLAAALRSALAQDFSELEIVVVDDAPPGSTWPRTEPYATLLGDPRVQLVSRNRRAGPPAARNAGWRAARGTWLCYLDDDNEYRPGKVTAQYELAQRSGAPLVLCGLEFRVGGRRRQKQVQRVEFRGDDLLLQAFADTNTLFHRRDVEARWDEELGTADDACLFQAIVRGAGLLAVPNVPGALVIYHAHKEARANPHWLRHHRGTRRLLIRWGHGYSRRAQRVQLCRSLLADDKNTPGQWCRFWSHAAALFREGGWGEWRTIANAAGVKLPLVRRWMIT